MDYYYSFDGMYSEEAFPVFAVVLVGVILLTGAIGIVSYILNSLSLYTIAKRRQIKGAGWAWAPMIGIDWLIGKLADQYILRQSGKEKKFSKTLLTLTIIATALMVLAYIVLIVWMIGLFAMGFEGTGDGAAAAITMMFVVYGVMVAMFIVIYAAAIVEYIALYHVYESCVPGKGIWMTLLVFFFGRLALAISLAVIRNKDEGFAEIEEHEREIANKYRQEEPAQELPG